jgi:hypothetical protein
MSAAIDLSDDERALLIESLAALLTVWTRCNPRGAIGVREFRLIGTLAILDRVSAKDAGQKQTIDAIDRSR